MQRNHYKVVRRGQQWMVRTPRSAFGQNDLWELSKEPGVVKYKTVWRPYKGYYDHDFLFNTKGEALMFMLRCSS